MPTPTEPEDTGSEEELAPGVHAAPGGLRFAFARSSGPGGQNVNKVSSRAELRIAMNDILGMPDDAVQRLRQFAGKRLNRDDEIVLHCGTHRSQRDNREECLNRLRELVAKAMVRPRTRRKSRPSRASKERRLKAKRVTGEKKSLRRSPRDE